MNKLITYIKLIRVDNWTKNVALFAPLFFSGQFFNTHKLVAVSLGFMAFCLVASSVYILNDLQDIERDRQHPTKKNRPLANGSITKNKAISITLLLLSGAIILAVNIAPFFLLIIGIYLGMNIAYSYKLKHIAIVDILIISIGFLLRIAAGGILADIEISHWLIIMTFLLSLFLALAKRRDDVLLTTNTGTKMRNAIDGYNIEFINHAMGIMASVIIVSYIMYVTSTEILERFQSKYIYLSFFFVIAGVLRYLQITLVQEQSGSPSKILLKDRFIQICIVCWTAYFLISIYFL